MFTISDLNYYYYLDTWAEMERLIVTLIETGERSLKPRGNSGPRGCFVFADGDYSLRPLKSA